MASKYLNVDAYEAMVVARAVEMQGATVSGSDTELLVELLVESAISWRRVSGVYDSFAGDCLRAAARLVRGCRNAQSKHRADRALERGHNYMQVAG